jgi:hypothetical protein
VDIVINVHFDYSSGLMFLNLIVALVLYSATFSGLVSELYMHIHIFHCIFSFYIPLKKPLILHTYVNVIMLSRV